MERSEQSISGFFNNLQEEDFYGFTERRDALAALSITYYTASMYSDGDGYFGVPRMEIAGTALATVIANGTGLMVTLYILHCTVTTCACGLYWNSMLCERLAGRTRILLKI